MSEYIYSAISNRRICAAYARFGSQSHLDRHEALSCIRLSAPKRASPAPLRPCGSVLSVKLSDIALFFELLSNFKGFSKNIAKRQILTIVNVKG